MKRVVLAALLIAPLTSHAADNDGNFRSKGFGLESCQRYTAERSNNSATYYLSRSWLNGYLTAHNLLRPGVYDAVGDAAIDTLAALLENYCRANPQRNFVTAAAVLISVLEPLRLQQRPQIIEVTVQGQTIKLAQETMQKVQQALKDQGHYAGAVDGFFGRKTQAALEAFQRDSGLAVTGLPDQATIMRLLLKR